MIIDDNSKKDLLSEIPLHNAIVVESEFVGAGELLPYYYFYKLKPFDKAMVLHDSMFIQKPVDFDSVSSVKFLWHFGNHAHDNTVGEERLIQLLDNHDDLLKYYRAKQWHGCFGVASIVSYDYVKQIQDKYNFFVLVNHVKTRQSRQFMERIFATVAFVEAGLDRVTCSIGGEIGRYPNNFYARFHQYKQMTNKPLAIYKVWCGR